jgi:hypothetical protein
MDSNPLVSCLCPSRPCRWGLLQRAVIDFNTQTYPNRELVITVDVAGEFSTMVQAYVDTLTLTASVRVLARPMRCQLEGLQYGAMAGFGSVLALWDDDNLNHPDRLRVQVSHQVNVPQAVTVFSAGLYFFHQDVELFAVDCAQPNAKLASDRVLSTTTMAYRDQFPTLDNSIRSRTSDTMITVSARNGKRVSALSDPFMHVVTVAAPSDKCESSREYDYHRTTATTRCGQRSDWIRSHQSEITAVADQIRWDGDVSVEGEDGGTFTYTPKLRWPSTLYPVASATRSP